MLGFWVARSPSPTLGGASTAGYLYLKCDASVATRTRPLLSMWFGGKTTPIHELERYMHCKDCSRGYAFKGSHLVAVRQRKI
jgi:hypothetical protein